MLEPGGKYEVWDRVTGNMVEFETREEAERAIAGPHESDFIIIVADED